MNPSVLKRSVLASLILGALSFFSVPVHAARPNVVLVMTDDQGYGDFSCHGNPIVKTPHLDKLHAESVRFHDFHVDPSCAPTRAALLTGRYSTRVGVWDTSSGRQLLRRGEVTMAEVFKENGYRTAIFGKWHLGHNYPYLPENRGFDEALVFYSGGIGQGPDYWGNDYFDDTYFRNGKPEKQKGYCTDIWFQEGMRFVEENRERPFFLYLPTNAPHGPLFVEEKYSKPYEEKGVSPPHARYFGMCENIDDNVALLRKKLRELDLEKNTIFIFMTDNGAGVGFKLDQKYHGFVTSGYNAGMRGAKQSMYEGGHRVPLFLRWPGGNIGGGQGRTIETLTAHIDLLPTLIDLCGLNPPDGVRFDGTSLKPLLQGKTDGWPSRKLVVSVNREEYPPRWHRTAILTERWRLINGERLFDIQADPGQRKEISREHPEVVTKLSKWYDTHWKSLAPRFSEYARIPIGDPAANPTVLTAHDLLEYTKKLAIEIIRDGNYEISLLDQRPEQDIPLGATAARVELGDAVFESPADPKASRVVLKARLTAGKAFLTARLKDAKSGKMRHAKFVSVRYIGAE